MANTLTGDFDAILQVSGSTLNRLLASMHQNAGLTTMLPTFPHSVSMRIGDPTPIDGMRGQVSVQLSVPHIDLIHGAKDRFNLEVGVRARYKPDRGLTPVPEFIHGTLRAQYQIRNIDPSCNGWDKSAADYLWITVVGSTVAFEGTAVDASDPSTDVQPSDAATNKARITRLASYLLENRFEATPQKVERRFHLGSMRSLNLAVNRSVVAVPLAGQGELASITHEWLDGRDFGVAISRAFLLSIIQRELDNLKAEFVTITEATVQWSDEPPLGGSVGMLTIRIVVGAGTQDARLNLDYELSQVVMISFDGINEKFVATAVGAPKINPSGSVGMRLGVADKRKIAEEFTPVLQNLQNKLVGSLSVKNLKTDLIRQLAKLDATPDAHLDEAIFGRDGVIVRGNISLSPRRSLAAEFVVSNDGFDALRSWIPGGRIDSLEWSWRWFNKTKPAGAGLTHSDRFVLRRPRQTQRRKFGMINERTHRLPVADGWGRMCLTIKGVRVDPISGALVPVSSIRSCLSAGFDVRVRGVAGGRVWLRDWVTSAPDPVGSMEELSLVDVGDTRKDRGSNTLVVYLGDRWNAEILAVLQEALLASRRLDAGLQILLLFRDGAVTRHAQILDEVSQFEGNLEAPLMVNEDVEGTWSGALSLDPRERDQQWRLVTPTGGVSWRHTGSIDPRQLGEVLDVYLFAAPPPKSRLVRPAVAPGTRLNIAALAAGRHDSSVDDLDHACPPPFGSYTRDARAVFVKAGSAASRAVINRLAKEHTGQEREQPLLALIVDGLTYEELERLRKDFPKPFVAIPDPRGVIASRFGIRSWPTALTVTDGTVTAVDVGAEWSGDSSDSERPS